VRPDGLKPVDREEPAGGHLRPGLTDHHGLLDLEAGEIKVPTDSEVTLGLDAAVVGSRDGDRDTGHGNRQVGKRDREIADLHVAAELVRAGDAAQLSGRVLGLEADLIQAVGHHGGIECPEHAIDDGLVAGGEDHVITVTDRAIGQCVPVEVVVARGADDVGGHLQL